MGPAVRIFQELDASGAPSPIEFLQPIPSRFPRTSAQVVFEYLQRLQLARTERNGVYRYSDPGRGSGWLRVEGVGPILLDDLERQVEVLVVSQRIGASDPHQQPEFFGQSTVIRSSNPHIQIGIGVVLATTGALLVFAAFASRAPIAAMIVLLVFGVLIFAGATAVIIVGARRLAWWRRARADVRARGERMPEHLRILD